MLVTVNQKVSIVDFYVRDTKSYQIMLEDELFLLELEKGANGFGYAFAIDKQADTDRNKARRVQKNRSVVWIVLGALAFFGIAGGLAAWVMTWQEGLTLKKNLPLLDEIGVITYGRVAQDNEGTWTLYFTEGPMVYEIELDRSAVHTAGLHPGDDQGVVYLKGNPKVNRVDWGHPGPLRSGRLLGTWMDRWSIGDPALKSCLEQEIRRNPEWLTDPAAPWLLAGGGGLTDWLAGQNISVRARLEASCGPLPAAE